MTLALITDQNASASLAADLSRPRKAAFVGGYRKEWFDGEQDVPGISEGAWCFDLSTDSAGWSFPKNAAPVNGDTINDVFDGDDDATGYGAGSVAASATAVFDYDGRGIKLSTYTAIQVAGVRAPAAVSAAMWANGDQFLAYVYVDLPSEANWPSFAGTTPSILTMAGTTSTDPTAFALRMVNASGVPAFWFQRHVATSTDETLGIAGGDIPFGETALMAIYRNADGVFGYVRSDAIGEIVRPFAGNSTNAADYSAARATFGIAGSSQGNPSHIASSTSNDLRYHRILAGGLEALGLTGRDPLAILRADWALQKRRAEAFSAGPLV